MATSKGGRNAQKKNQRSGETEALAMKTDLERTYKPIFDQFAEEGGIPFSVLRETLVEKGGVELSPQKLELLLRRADTDKNRVLDYDEFVRLMESEEGRGLTTRDLTKLQKLVRTAVSSVMPRGQYADDGAEFVEDYSSRYSCCPPPLFMIGISLIELGIFIGYAVYLKNEFNIPTTMVSGAPLSSPLVYNPYRRYEAWRYVSYMFIHDGIRHILSNLIFQLLIGLPLELVHKFWRVGLVYFFGVLAGSLCTSMVDSYIFLVGASGGCYALIGAHFATIIMNWKDMTHDWMSGPIKFLMSAPVQLAFWSLYAGVDTGVAIYSRYFSPEQSRVAYAAHFAGLGAGILMGIPILKNFQVLPWEKVLWWVCLVIYLILVSIAICYNCFVPRYPATDWRDCCPSPYSYRPY